MYRITLLDSYHNLLAFIAPVSTMDQTERANYWAFLHNGLPEGWVVGNITPIPERLMREEILQLPVLYVRQTKSPAELSKLLRRECVAYNQPVSS